MRTAVILGASGYTGRALTTLLAQRTSPASVTRVVAHIRPNSGQTESMRSLCEEVGATLHPVPWTADAMGAFLRDTTPTFLFACLGTTRRRAKEEEGATYERVDFGLTHMAMEAAAALPTPPRFVYLSAMGAGKPSRNPYMHARYRMEKALEESVLPWTIVRPAFVSGPDRTENRPMERAGAVLFDGLLNVAGALGGRRLQQRYRSIDATGLARAMIRLAESDHRDGACRVHLGDALQGGAE